MKIIHKDIWRYPSEGYCIIIPINTHVNTNGLAAMGFGLAYQARRIYKNIAITLGSLIKAQGPKVFYLERQKLILFPTKAYWRDNSKIEIIESSCQQVVKLLETFPDMKIAMPKIGCGHGKLDWNVVKQIVEKHFKKYGDRVIIVDNEQGACGKEWKGDNV